MCNVRIERTHVHKKSKAFHCGNFHENHKYSRFFGGEASLVQKVIQIGGKCGELGQNFIHTLIKRMPFTRQIITKIMYSTVLLYHNLMFF